jgi:hypothetical protein
MQFVLQKRDSFKWKGRKSLVIIGAAFRRIFAAPMCVRSGCSSA